MENSQKNIPSKDNSQKRKEVELENKKDEELVEPEQKLAKVEYENMRDKSTWMERVKRKNQKSRKKEEKELAESEKEFVMTKDEELERKINVDKKNGKQFKNRSGDQETE